MILDLAGIEEPDRVGVGPSPVGKSISARDRGSDALDGGFSSLLEDGSGKIGVVEWASSRFS